ncbi:NAD-dependent dehydratase [Caulobacter mirabilis]|uniref:NAD-dependent dehydratase n=1 Tax=Caulobacter mirabilis TaxID=69666 RepID=A0A2D2AYB5_9CAUL|nr:NAD-dependent dehydratase [Caulobacter mirabilis]
MVGNIDIGLARAAPVRAGLAARTVAVTGGAGFIGSHLCDAILESGARVVCIDNFHTGRWENIHHLIDRPGFDVLEHDIAHPLPASLPRFDQIYNFACPASPVHYQSDRVRTALTCAQGAMNVLERAAQDAAAVLHASTSEVYGDPEIHPQSEDYFGNVNPVGPRSCYDEGKRFAETLLTDFAAQADLDVRIIRIFNTYGPRMRPDDGRVVSNFVTQALEGETITVYGDGAQTRSFCFVDDLVRGCLKAMNTPRGLPGPVNLGNPCETTVGELAELIVAMTGSRSEVSYRPLPVDDPRRRRPDIRRARELLGWSPEVPLREGLERTIHYFMGESRRLYAPVGSGAAMAAASPM